MRRQREGTFDGFGESVGLGHVFDFYQFEFAAAESLVEEVLHPLGFGDVARGSADSEAGGQELLGDMGGDEPGNAGDQDDGAGGNSGGGHWIGMSFSE